VAYERQTLMNDRLTAEASVTTQTQGRAAPPWLILTLVCTAQFMVVLDVSIVNIALPAMDAELGLGVEGLQWVVNGYVLTSAGFLLLGGRAADLYGRRRVFIAGMALFTLASLVGGAATTAGLLVAARVVQGLGAAVISPATLTILTTSFAEGAYRTKAIATWGAIGAVGGAAGSILGGFLTQALSWRWILLINVPIGIIAIGIAFRYLAESRDGVGRRLDLTGAITVTLGLMGLEYGLIRTHDEGWGSPYALVPMTAGVLLLAAFVVVQARFAKDPLVPLRAFRVRSVTGATVVQLLLGAAGFAMWYFLSLYLQQALHYSPVQAGLAIIPHSLAIVVASKITPRLIGRMGLRSLIALGALMASAGFLWQAQMTADSGYVTGVLLPGLLITTGMGLSFAPLALAATTGVARGEEGLVSGLLNCSRQFGGSLGLAGLVTLAAAHTLALSTAGTPEVSALSAGYARAFLVSAVIAAVAALATIAIPGRRATRDAGH